MPTHTLDVMMNVSIKARCGRKKQIVKKVAHKNPNITSISNHYQLPSLSNPPNFYFEFQNHD